MTKGRKAGRASKKKPSPLLSSRSGSATVKCLHGILLLSIFVHLLFSFEVSGPFILLLICFWRAVFVFVLLSEGHLQVRRELRITFQIHYRLNISTYLNLKILSICVAWKFWSKTFKPHMYSKRAIFFPFKCVIIGKIQSSLVRWKLTKKCKRMSSLPLFCFTKKIPVHLSWNL